MGQVAIQAGETYEVAYPFVRSTYETRDFDADTGMDYVSDVVDCWKPGIESEMVYHDEAEAVADGVGKMLLTVVSVHPLPRPYPTRVFFVREWVDPDGKRFGKKKMHIMTLAAFRRRASGFSIEYRMRQRAAA
jgi:hypothetical protein